jgi:GNAT superfamily N-acetyltransferase
MTQALWQPMTREDIAAVDAIATRIHVGLPEHPFIFAERQRLYPDGCFMLDIDGRPAGYAISHPWHYLRPPSLNTLIERIPTDASTYYIHDVALLPEARRSGAGTAIARRLIEQARAAGLSNASLIAVYDAAPFWHRQGFQFIDDPALTHKLAGYGVEARMMVLPLEEAP